VPLPELDETVPEFPLAVFPPYIQSYIREVSLSIGTHPDFAAGAVLAYASAVLGNKGSLLLKPGYAVKANLWIGLIAGASTGKSPAMQLTREPLDIINAELLAAFRQKKQEYHNELIQYDIDLKKHKAGEGIRPDKPKMPHQKVIYTCDPTIDVVACLLRENPNGMLLFKDELASFVLGMDQYRSGKGSERQAWLSSWSRVPLNIQRKAQYETTGEGIIVENPYISIIGGTTPDQVPLLVRPDQQRDGFLARFLFSAPPGINVPNWSKLYVSDESKRTWRSLIKEIYDYTGLIDLRFSKDGEAAWIKGHDALSEKASASDLAPCMKEVYGKLREYGGRLALLLHVLHAVGGRIPLEANAASAERAWMLVDYFRLHAHKVWGRLTDQQTLDNAHTIHRWVLHKAKGDSFTRSMLTRASRKFANAQELDPALTLLEEHGVIKTLFTGPSAKRYLIRPHLRATQEGVPSDK
jgi:hypothetical protein